MAFSLYILLITHTEHKLSKLSTILQIAKADRYLSTLVKHIKNTVLEDTLSGRGPFTMLAPVNLAFENMGPLALAELLKQANVTKLSNLLSFHILAERKLLKDFRNGQKLKTISGQELIVSVINGVVCVNGAKILSRDKQGSNGVIHSIDTVNLPTEEAPVV
jgi:uncharacterized surface protein with fasciclin (FAS1) repeats